jgi:molecular chaperone GrpE
MMSIKHNEQRESQGGASGNPGDRKERGKNANEVADTVEAGDQARPIADCPVVTAEENGPEAAKSRLETAKNDSFELRALEAEAKIGVLETMLASVKEELAATNDKYLRKLADDANFRKRMTREKEDGQRFALVTLLGDLIPVMDDLDRAISSAEKARNYNTLHDGILLIRRQLGQMLESKYGLRRIESTGKPFDPNCHEAVAIVQGDNSESPGADEAVVAEEFLPGYDLHERVLRTAKVKVRMPAKPAETTEAGAGTAIAPNGSDENNVTA